MSRDKIYRDAIYQVLQGITVDYNGVLVSVPVFDRKMEDDSNLYIILSSQTAIWDGNFTQKAWQCMLEIEVFHHQQDSATFDITDDVSEIIENRIFAATPMSNNFAQVAGWQIINTYLSSSNSLKLAGYQSNAGTLINKTLQITSKIIKL